MTDTASSRTARAWSLCLLYLALIYATLPWARGAVIALRSRGLLSGVVTLLFFASAVAVVYYIVFDLQLSDRIAFFALALLAAGIGSLVLGLSIPEERIHFLEYGILALLARRAFSAHLRPGRSYGAAWGFASLAGWADELIQRLLPDRVFDWRDVAINSVAALLTLAADEVLHDRLEWQSRRA